jgi:thiamine biosynthesis lipoprotein
MTHVFVTMGTVVSLDPAMQVDAVEAVFAGYDRRFSLYRPASELSRIADGSLDLSDAGNEVRAAYACALEWRAATDGIFTPHRPDGTIDLNGVVKALAMREVGALLGADDDWTLSVGGDVLASRPRTVVGIVDPTDRTRLLTSLTLAGGRRAVATSGIAERGDHLWGRGGFAQVSVVGDDILTADVLATTIAAGGLSVLNQCTARFDIDVLAIDLDGNLFATPGMRAQIASLAGSPH